MLSVVFPMAVGPTIDIKYLDDVLMTSCIYFVANLVKLLRCRLRMPLQIEYFSII